MKLNEQEILTKLHRLKAELKDQVVVLGHHYQTDSIIDLADIRGDSLRLAKAASKTDKPYIVFCGVHFMAETADMLTNNSQKVILPDLQAGCSMADMATGSEVEEAWKVLSNATEQSIIPITYVNCTAELKAFVGENNGSICTSSNAEKIISWGLEKGEKLLFFPDQHLGRNTCHKLGIPLNEMVIYDPKKINGGLTKQQICDARVILWYGYCSVHQGFTKGQIDILREKSPETQIIVHPECNFEVVDNADDAGSTAYIIESIDKAPAGSKFAVGTEINLVNRLANLYTDKQIISLSPYQCLCSTMYRIRPECLLKCFESIQREEPINVIQVDREITGHALRALDTMLSIS